MLSGIISSGAIFNKSLSLDQKTLGKFSLGNVISLVSNDVRKLDFVSWTMATSYVWIKIPPTVYIHCLFHLQTGLHQCVLACVYVYQLYHAFILCSRKLVNGNFGSSNSYRNAPDVFCVHISMCHFLLITHPPNAMYCHCWLNPVAETAKWL